jgi:ribonuclease BN (tRNA processing enzyme)
MEKDGEDQGQTGTTGAAWMAASSGVSKLILVHHGPQLDPPDQRDRALEDVAAVFDGETVYADEGFELELS